MESVADPDSDESGSSIHFRAAWSSSSDEDSSVLVSDDSLFELDVLSVLEPSFDWSDPLSSISVKHGCYQYVVVIGTLTEISIYCYTTCKIILLTSCIYKTFLRLTICLIDARIAKFSWRCLTFIIVSNNTSIQSNKNLLSNMICLYC